jgi:hypothetical protein
MPRRAAGANLVFVSGGRSKPRMTARWQQRGLKVGMTRTSLAY